MTIPIRNIYYLLLYAWDALDAAELVSVEASESPKVLDLLASVIDAGARHALKHGLHRGYVDRVEQRADIRGRLLVARSVRSLSLQSGRAVCEIDELTHDVLENRIVVSTLSMIKRTEGLDRRVRDGIDETLRRFPVVTPLTIQPRHFASVAIHRNNRVYAMLLDACRLAHRRLMPVEGGSAYRFRDFTRSRQQMHRLFERFLLGFYRREQSTLRVERTSHGWSPVECSEHDRAYLPRLATDITLKSATRRVVIEAKFYRDPLARGQHGKPTVHPGHLRQIYAYVRNSALTVRDGVVPEGIVLYAGTGQHTDLRYTLHGYPLRFLTLDLNADWPEIRESLLTAIGRAESGESAHALDPTSFASRP